MCVTPRGEVLVAWVEGSFSSYEVRAARWEPRRQLEGTSVYEGAGTVSALRLASSAGGDRAAMSFTTAPAARVDGDLYVADYLP